MVCSLAHSFRYAQIRSSKTSRSPPSSLRSRLSARTCSARSAIVAFFDNEGHSLTGSKELGGGQLLSGNLGLPVLAFLNQSEVKVWRHHTASRLPLLQLPQFWH